MRKVYNLLIIITFGLILPTTLYSQQQNKRTPYNIPLIKLSVSNDDNNSKFKKIRISINGSKEYAIITRYNDFYIKNIRMGLKKTTYAERIQSMYTLTDFEAQQINKILKSFISTLDVFERDLQKKRWDKCLYLDSFFPRFLKGFYYLSCTAFNTRDALSENAKVTDSMFDVSLKSKKSDQRINKWLNSKDYVIKLRIVTRELIFQLKKWQKNELNRSKRKIDILYNSSLKEAYNLFIKMYFCL